MNQIPTQVSESVRRKNPHLYGPAPVYDNTYERSKPAKRIRQSSKPVLNKLEQGWLDYAKRQFAHERPIMAQSIGFRLGNGVVYWPDFVSESFTHAWEIKGRQPIQDDSVVKIKVAARLFPQIEWRLVWKNFNGAWVEQKVLA